MPRYLRVNGIVTCLINDGTTRRLRDAIDSVCGYYV